MAYEIVEAPFVWGTPIQVNAPEGKVVYNYHIYDSLLQCLATSQNTVNLIFTDGQVTGVDFRAQTISEGIFYLICDGP